MRTTTATLALVALVGTLSFRAHAQLDQTAISGCQPIHSIGEGTATSEDIQVKVVMAVWGYSLSSAMEYIALLRAKRSAYENLQDNCDVSDVCEDACEEPLHPTGSLILSGSITYEETKRVWTSNVSWVGSWSSVWIRVKATGQCCCYCTTFN